MTKEPKVIVAILNYCGGHIVRQCIESVISSAYKNYEVLVIDNNSTDTSLSDIRCHFPFIPIVVNDSNRGTAAGYNICLKAALARGGDYILLLNNDIILDAHCITELIRVAEVKSDTGAVGGRIFFLDHPRMTWSFGGRINPLLCTTRHITEKFPAGTVLTVDYIPAAVLLLPVASLKTIGWFDERYFMYYEDVDFGYRINQCGLKNYVTENAIAWHKVGSRKGEYNITTTYYPIRNKMLFARCRLNFISGMIFWQYLPFFLIAKCTLIILGKMFRRRRHSLVRIKYLLFAVSDFWSGISGAGHHG